MKLFPEVAPTELLPALADPERAARDFDAGCPLADLRTHLLRGTPDVPWWRHCYWSGSPIAILCISGIKGRP